MRRHRGSDQHSGFVVPPPTDCSQASTRRVIHALRRVDHFPVRPSLPFRRFLLCGDVMVFRSFLMRVLPSLLFVCVLVPGRGSAQVAVGLGFGAGPGRHGAYPPPPPDWNYPGLAGGPYVTGVYPFVGWPGYRGAFGSYWTNGLSLYGPPVPVYGPIPGVLGNDDLVRQWHARPTLGAGIGYYGWVGPFRASPRPPPQSVNL